MVLMARRFTGLRGRCGVVVTLIAAVATMAMAIAAPAQAHSPYNALAWGQDGEGTLGYGGGGSRTVPVQVSGLSGVTAIASERGTTFYGQALALLESGTVMAWGRNGSGEVGDGTKENKNVPAAVCAVGEKAPCAKHLGGVKAIAAGALHSLAVLEGGTVVEWGRSGDGSETAVPVAKSGLSEVRTVEAGSEYSLALRENGTVMAWGEGASGQLGNGSETKAEAPVAVCAVGEKAPCVKDLEGVKAVAAGAHQSLALLENGTVVAWGRNTSGELGNGTETTSSVPVVVCAVGAKSPCSEASQQLKGVSAIAGGEVHSMALLENGTVVDWGGNTGGQLGIGSKEPEKSTTPVIVCAVGEPEKGATEKTPCAKDLSGVTAIAAGGESPDASYALLGSGGVVSWGDGSWYELGDGSTESRSVPVAVCAAGETEGKGKAPCTKNLAGAKGIAGGDEQGFAFGPFLAVTAISPKEGGRAGGTEVTITGSAFEGVSAVKFGSTSAKSFKVNSETSITAVSPAGSGTVDITVAAAAGTSAPSVADQFTYVHAAGEPGEYGQCRKVNEPGDVEIWKYQDANCQTFAPKHRGKYEWFAGPAPSCIGVKRNGRYSDPKCETLDEKHGKPVGRYEKTGGGTYTSSGGEATLELPSLHITVKCSASTDVGEITGPQTDADAVKFTGCETSGQKCTALEGAKAEGEIPTYALTTTLIAHSERGPAGKEPAPGEVWTEYANAAGPHAPYVAAFVCGSVGFFRIKGSISGVTSGNMINKMGSASQVAFGTGGGEQALETEVSPSSEFKAAERFASTLTTTAHDSFGSQMEIRA